MNARELVKNFVTIYNKPGSDVFPLYGNEVEWIEMPSGRRVGRADLFRALREAREFLTDLRLETLSIVANECDAVLESAWRARTIGTGETMSARIIWFFAFKDGKIVKEHDYSIMTT